MRRVLAATLLSLSLAACGSEPTAQEESLEERASGPDQLAPENIAVSGTAANEVGGREGISGTTQGPTAGDSDAPHAGDDSATSPN